MATIYNENQRIMKQMNDRASKKIYASVLTLYIVAAIAFECTANTARISTIGIYLVFAVGIFSFFKNQSICYNSYIIFSVIFLLYIFIMSFVNRNSMSDTLVYFCLTCIILCVVGYNIYISIGKEKATMICLLAFVIGSIILAIRIIIAYGGIAAMLEFSSQGVHERRIGGALINENTLGLYMANAFFCCVVMSIKIKTKKPVFSFGFILLSICFVVMLLLTASKKAILFLIVGIVLLVISSLHNQNWQKKILILFSAIIGLILLYIIINQIPFFRTIILRINTLFHALSGEGETSESDKNRMSMMAQGLSAFLDSPVFGNGTAYSYSLFNTYSHNNFIELLMNYGVIGFSLYYIPCIFLIKRLIILSRKRDLFALYYLMFVALQVFLGIGWVNYYERIIQLFTILAAGYCDMSCQNETEKPRKWCYIR